MLQSRLIQRVRDLGFQSYEDYFDYLFQARDSGEFASMVNAVTINETFFFRTQDQFDLIKNALLPRLIERSKPPEKKTIRIWSAACSTGDEPYSLAILLKELFIQRFPHITFEIFASDIDSDILSRARRGAYSAYAIRHVPPQLLQKYFSENNEHYQLNESIRSMVQFKQINLADRMAMMRMNGIDLAICANVLIYFPKPIKENVVHSIYNALNPGGLFIIGISETLFGINHPFTLLKEGKSVVYCKA